MEFTEFQGKTVDDAVIEAAATLGVASTDLDIEVVSKGSAGFFGIGAKPAVIKVKAKVEKSLDDILYEDVPSAAGKNERTAEKKTDKEADEKAEKKTDYKTDYKTEKKEYVKFNGEAKAEKKEAPAKKEEPAKPVTPIPESAAEEAKIYVENIFSAMELKDVKVETAIDQENHAINIDVEGPDMGFIIGKHGATLDALQYLISLYVNKNSESYIRVKLDTENYRERRRETLENLAKNIAFKVKKTRRPVTLEPMNPYERRIIHSTLQSDRYVTTRSEGEEPYRKVIIYLKRR